MLPRKYKVQNANSREEYLNHKLLAVVGLPSTSERLAATLFHISQMDKIPSATIEAIQAVAFILEEEATTSTIKELKNQITEGTSKEVASQVITSIAPHVANMLKASDSLNSKISQLITQNLQMNAPTTTTSSPATNMAMFYSAIIKSNANLTQINPQASAALARAVTRDCQILLDPLDEQPLHDPSQTASDIAEQLQAAIEMAHGDDTPIIAIKAITCLHNGALLLELDSTLSAKWLRHEDNKKKFIDALGKPVSIKNCLFPVLIPFLPVSSPIETDNWLKSVELENHILTGSIRSARWVKPVLRRAPNQRVAHTILQMTTPQAANTIIRDGVYI
ncbi:hypothetical protein PAXRUDRAFT_164420 [Paxillus rubicundulus Ve08.2h10]|uniref:Uncharacterized protein n=1 Tax=Paxillus rubicundulus Ve08.2h10 TaxID=930991 RepID=A0A0D0C535_9AGAM|nr:hypothetical protein PAXRUDRAFT_164420 [Paxillus rubicundulus Ve08.2h10]